MQRKVALLVTLLLCLSAIPLLGQTVTGTLEGRVVDRTGAVIPNAQVSIKAEDTGLAREAMTNGEGYYAFRFVPIGSYDVTAKAQGFGGVKKSSVVITLNTTTTSDFTLNPQAVSETVNVTGEAALIETAAADFKNTFETRAIEDRPLPTRNFLYFAETVPGFQENPVSGQNNPTASSGSSVNFNGTGTRGTTFQINGVNNDDSSENQQRQGVNISTISQVQVMTNNFSAEFGRGYGTVVLVQTKQGTNRFHGDVFWFHLNNYFNARDWFQSPTVYDVYLKMDPNTGKSLCTTSDQACYRPYKVTSNRRHDYGYTVGGPIIKNKLFFFNSMQMVKSGGGATFRKDIFLPSERSVPASVTDPRDRAWIQKLIEAYPAATPNDPTNGPRAFMTSYSYHYPDWDYTGRVDWNASAKNTFTARYQWSHQTRAADEIIKGEGTLQNNHQQNLGLTWAHIFSNTQTGEFRVGLGRRETNVDLKQSGSWDSPWGVPIVRFSSPNNPGSYYASTTMGSSGVYPILRYQTDWQFVYNHFWMVTPKLTLKAGTDVRPGQLNDVSDQYSRGYWILRDQGPAPKNPDGSTFTLAQWQTDSRCPMKGQNSDCPYKDAYWSVLHGMYGVTSSDFQKAYGPRSLANKLNEANFYLQADYKLFPTLTINLGFRDEWVAAVSERAKRIEYGYNDRNYAAPRIGFAYSPNFNSGLLHTITGGPGKMSVHGGFGMFTGRVFQSFFSQNGASVRFTPPYGFQPSFTNLALAAGNVYVPGAMSDVTNGYTYDHSVPALRWSPTVIDKKLYSPYTEQWNMTLQREVSNSMAFTLAYVGSRGVGLPFYNTVNRAPFPAVGPAPVYSGTANDMIPSSGTYKGVNFSGVIFDCVDPNLLTTTPMKDPVTGHQCISLGQPFTNFRRPDPRYSSYLLIRNGNRSWYNAFQASFKRRLAKGMAWDINYTFGKALDTGSEATYTGLESGSPITEFDDGRLNKGFSLFDTPQRLTANFTYEIPFFKNQNVQQFGSIAGPVVGRIIGGWQISGTYIYASGTPFGVTAGYDLNADGTNNDRPNLVDPSVLGTSVDNPRSDPAWTAWYANALKSQHQLSQAAFYPNVYTPSASRVFMPGLTNAGSLGRNTFRSNGRDNIDAALSKNFRITEGTRMVFRYEIYNVANHPQFYLPGGTTSYSTSATSWMRITGTRNNRVDTGTGARYMQFALRFVF